MTPEIATIVAGAAVTSVTTICSAAVAVVKARDPSMLRDAVEEAVGPLRTQLAEHIRECRG